MSVLDKFRLDNRVALVTGGNRGLGKEMSTALAEAGAQVAIVSRKTEEAQAIAAGIQQTTGKAPRPDLGADLRGVEEPRLVTGHREKHAALPLQPDETGGGSYSRSGVLRGGSGTHLLLTQPPGSGVTQLTLTGPGGDALSTAIVPRLAVARIR